MISNASVPDVFAVCSALRALGENLAARHHSLVGDTLVRLAHPRPEKPVTTEDTFCSPL